MELYDSANVEADLARIEAEIEPHYAERLAEGTIKSYSVKVDYVNMNRFTASVEYLPAKDGERFGPITAWFEILIRNGRIEFQNGF
jgi:hypothetical protein